MWNRSASPANYFHEPSATTHHSAKKGGLKLVSEIAGKEGPVLASAELGNGPGVDGSPAVHSADAGIGATLSTNF